MAGGRRHAAVLCFAVCLLLAVSGRHIMNRRDGDHQNVPLLTFKLTKITQQLTDDGYRIRLHLNGTVLPKVYFQQRIQDQQEFLGTPSNGTVEFYSQTGNAKLFFLHPRGYQILILQLNEHSPSEQLVPDVELSNQGGRNITFQRGNDADVHIILTVGNDQNSMSQAEFEFSMAVKSNRTDNLVEEYYGSDRFPFEVFNQSRSEGERHVPFRILTSSGDVEGLMGLHVWIDLTQCRPRHSCGRGYYLIHEDVPVYQEDHTGPFPENFIGFVKHRHEELTNEVVCSIRRRCRCRLRCEFVGDKPSAVEFVRVSGHLTPTRQMYMSNDGFRAVGHIWFENVTANEEVEYQCKSSSGSVTVNRTMKMIAVHEAKISRDLSIVTTLDNGAVEAVCVADGTPAPTLSFYDSNHSAISDVLNSDSYDIDVMTPPTESSSKVMLRIHDPAVANRLRYVLCKAENEVRGHHFEDFRGLNVAQREATPIPYSLYNGVDQNET